jgi:hypothetical protein
VLEEVRGGEILAVRGADVNYQDAKGKTALHYGVEKAFDPALEVAETRQELQAPRVGLELRTI